MGKNGKLFVSIIDQSDFAPTIWDPYFYRHNGDSQVLSDFAEVARVTVNNYPYTPSPFAPIEYRDIPKGSHYLGFALRPKTDEASGKNLPSVGENQILFGTMRAYLGNVIVTPLAEWLGEVSPLHFSIKSEFAIVLPYDNLTYFWFAYMRSRHFLDNLPVGSGGTRPRLQPEALRRTPVRVPPLHIRREIHEELEYLARKEWEIYSRTLSTLKLVNLLLEEKR